jgi:Retrotransposon gag protein
MSAPIIPGELFQADGTLNASASSLSREDFAALTQQLAQELARRDALHTQANDGGNPALVSSTSAVIIEDSSTLRVLQQRLRPFDGRRDVRSLEDYIDSMENYFAVASTLTESSKLAIAVSYLDRTAATWWKSHLRSTPEDLTGQPHPQRIRRWLSMRQALLAEFYPTDVIRSARDRLAKLRQTNSVKEYVERFRNLELQIPDLSDSEKVDRFRRGLKDSVRLQVALQPGLRNSDFATLVASAIEIDDIIYRSKRERHLVSHTEKREQNRKDHDSMDMEIDVIDFRNKSKPKGHSPTKRVPLTVEERARLIAKKGCFYCRKEQAGHVIKECPTRLADEFKKYASDPACSGKVSAQ